MCLLKMNADHNENNDNDDAVQATAGTYPRNGDGHDKDI